MFDNIFPKMVPLMR